MLGIRLQAVTVAALCALAPVVPSDAPVFESALAFAQAPASSSLPSEASAAGPVRPGGLWYGFAVGWGWSRVDCEICRGNLTGGATGMLRGGITQSRALDLGLEINGWHQDQEGVNRWHGTFSLMAYFFPGPVRRLSLNGGLGITLYRASDAENAFTSTSFGPQFGVGYEIPVGTGLTFTPQLEVVAAGIGDLEFNGEGLGSGSLQLIKLGIGLTWH